MSGRWGEEEGHAGRRARITAAATELFGRLGYRRARLAELAEGLGVTKQALYYYFPDKRSLLAACALEAHRRAVALLEEAAPQAGEDGCTALARLLHRYALHACGRARIIMFLEAEELDAADRDRVLALRDRFDAGVRALIQRGIADGSLRAGDPRLMSFAVLGAVNWMARWARADGPLPLSQLAEAIVGHALAGIAKPR